MYGASSRIAYEILRDRPDYLEVMKVYAFSLYELGEYSEAKKYLLAYLEKESTDLESMVRLGETYGYL